MSRLLAHPTFPPPNQCQTGQCQEREGGRFWNNNDGCRAFRRPKINHSLHLGAVQVTSAYPVRNGVVRPVQLVAKQRHIPGPVDQRSHEILPPRAIVIHRIDAASIPVGHVYSSRPQVQTKRVGSGLISDSTGSVEFALPLPKQPRALNSIPRHSDSTKEKIEESQDVQEVIGRALIVEAASSRFESRGWKPRLR